jgi:ribosomal-protein-alanine N-acetyltransferase
VRLETERLILRPQRLDDLPFFVELYGDAEVMRYIGGGEPLTEPAIREDIVRNMRRFELDGRGLLVVESRGDGTPLGEVDLLPWDPDVWRPGIATELGDRAEIEIGWTFLRRGWGNGYATEAARALRDFAFASFGLERLISLIHEENPASIRVAEKLGERYERDVVTHRGVRARLYSLTRETTAAR